MTASNPYCLDSKVSEILKDPTSRTSKALQSKKMSLIETVVATLIRFVVSLGAQLVVFPAFGLQTSGKNDFAIAVIFTFVSAVCGYTVRRLFNWWHSLV